MLKKLIISGLIIWSACDVIYAAFVVTDFGAKGNGQIDDSVAIQSAVEACSATGGGIVIVPSGVFKCANIQLRNNVFLQLEPGSILKMNPEYDKSKDGFTVGALGITNTGICGSGIIDGSSYEMQALKVRPKKGSKIRILAFEKCSQITIKDVTLKNSYGWVQYYGLCDDLRIEGIFVNSRTKENNDGLDIDSCSRVMVRGCNIVAEDDSIVLKSTYDTPCRDVVVTDCILSSNCSGLKLGTESYGGFENIIFSNCIIYDNRSSAVALDTVDGGSINNITVNNICVRNARTALSVRLGSRNKIYYRGLPQKGPATMRNIFVSNIQADGIFGFPISICGVSDGFIENVVLSNIRVAVTGGGAVDRRITANAMVREFERVGDIGNTRRFTEIVFENDDEFVPEVPDGYPDDKVFGVLPAYGLYSRYVHGLVLDNVSLSYENEDSRPAIFADKLNGLTIRSLRARTASNALSVIRLRDVKDTLISGYHSSAAPSATAFLKADSCTGITLLNNDFSYVHKIFVKDDSTDIYSEANRTAQ